MNQQPSASLMSETSSDQTFRNAFKLQQTREHYDLYPYEVHVRGSKAYTSTRSHLGRFIAQIEGGLLLDVGCGPGNLLSALGCRATHTIEFDLSYRSLCQAAQAIVNSSTTLVQGNALCLPFADRSFDFVIASGSLHCTPDAKMAFKEVCRVLRPGGKAFITVYQAGSYYAFLYRTFGTLARVCERLWLTSFLVNQCLLFPVFFLYFLVGRLFIHHRFAIPSYTQVMNYFADQLLNPVVSFHNISEIARWAQLTGVEVIAVSRLHAGALLSIEVCRPAAM